MSNTEDRPVYTPAQILSRVLVGQNLAMDPMQVLGPEQQLTWPVYISHEPEQPVKLIAVYNTTPFTEETLLSGIDINWWGVMMMVRSEATSYNDGWAKIVRLTNWLTSRRRWPVTIESTKFVLRQVRLDTGPQDAGREDQNRRCLFSSNLLLKIGRA